MWLRGEAAQDGEPSSNVDNIRLTDKTVRGQALGLALLHANPLSKGIRKYITDLRDPSLRITKESASTFVSHRVTLLLPFSFC